MTTYKDPRHRSLSELKNEAERTYFEIEAQREAEKLISRVLGGTEFKAVVADKLSRLMRPQAPQAQPQAQLVEQPQDDTQGASIFSNLGGTR